MKSSLMKSILTNNNYDDDDDDMMMMMMLELYLGMLTNNKYLKDNLECPVGLDLHPGLHGHKHHHGPLQDIPILLLPRHTL